MKSSDGFDTDYFDLNFDFDKNETASKSVTFLRIKLFMQLYQIHVIKHMIAILIL